MEAWNPPYRGNTVRSRWHGSGEGGKLTMEDLFPGGVPDFPHHQRKPTPATD